MEVPLPVLEPLASKVTVRGAVPESGIAVEVTCSG